MPTNSDLQRQLAEARRELELLRGIEGHPPTPPQPALRIKLPSFWEAQPSAWFAQAELQFNAAGVTDPAAKLAHVLGSLAQDNAAEVTDLLALPPTAETFNQLKARLLERYAGSPSARLARLLEPDELGDRRPTELLRSMRQLAGSEVTEDLLRQLWLKRLPPTMRAVLLAQASTSLDDAARLGDAIAEATPPPAAVCAATAPAPPSEVAALKSCVEQLTQQVAALSKRRHTRHTSPQRPSPSRRGPSPRREGSDQQQDVCWYHRRWGRQATKCRPPCTMASGNESGGR